MRQPYRFTTGIGASLLLLLATYATAASPEEPEARLRELVDIAVAYTEHDMAVRAAAIEEAEQLLLTLPDAATELGALLGLGTSYLLYQNSDAPRAIERLEQGLHSITLDGHPELYFRCKAFLSGLYGTAGEPVRALEIMQTLFDSNLDQVPRERVENARVNYASVLRLNGQIQEAGQAFERALVYGLSENVPLLALSAGSNYVAMLRDQGLSGEADYWLNRLEGAMAEMPEIMATKALQMYRLGVEISEGRVDEALPKLERYIEKHQDGPLLVSGHGYELYAHALRLKGRFDESLRAAERALKLLSGYAIELPDARIELIRTLVAMGRYDDAQAALDQLEDSDITSPSNRHAVNELRLTLAVRTRDLPQIEQSYGPFLDSGRTLQSFISSRQTDYYDGRLSAQQTRLALERAQDAQALLQAEADAERARASELRVQSSQRNLQLLLVTLVALFAVALIYLGARRRLQRRLGEELAHQNARLSELVEEKSRALVEKVEQESRLQEALAERRRLEVVGQIAGHVAHDFNNVLQVVAGANELMRAEVHSESTKGALSASEQSVEAASATVRQLLSYARNQRLAETTFDVRGYLESNQALFRSAIGGVNDLVIEDQSKGKVVRLDSAHLTASIIQLLRNGADAMSVPGVITLRARLFESSETPAEALADAQLLALEVLDEGRGMSPEETQRALEPYYSTKAEHTGTGLGLSSVHGFVHQSGGALSISSKPGKGTQVRMMFPLVAEAPERCALAEPQRLHLADARVLLVEDNVQIARMLKALLEQETSHCEWVANADDARSVLAEGPDFDLLLSDVLIPGAMDGFGLARWARSEYPELRVGLMSGYGPTETDPPVPLLSKPFTHQRLLEYLAAL